MNCKKWTESKLISAKHSVDSNTSSGILQKARLEDGQEIPAIRLHQIAQVRSKTGSQGRDVQRQDRDQRRRNAPENRPHLMQLTSHINTQT